MGERTSIEWTDSSWSPIRARNKATGKIGWHCEHASEGCRNCYAEGINKRLGTGLPFKPGHRDDIEIFLDEKMLLAPLRWKKPRMIFVCSMTDIFAEFVKDEWIDRIFAVMALCPQHAFQVLTKRSGRMKSWILEAHCPDGDEYAPGGGRMYRVRQHIGHFADWARDNLKMTDQGWDRLDDNSQLWGDRWPLPNVWLGVSVEDQANADSRIPDLLATPAAIRFVSYEPALGPVAFGPWLHDSTCDLQEHGAAGTCTCSEPREVRIDWIIAGGESGQNARPAHPDWFRSARDQCAAAGVAFFFKQFGEWLPVSQVAESDEFYHPAPAQHPDATRRCKYETTVVHTDGSRHGNLERGAWEAGTGAMLTFRVGKKRAGRLLDGVEHNAMPERAR